MKTGHGAKLESIEHLPTSSTHTTTTMLKSLFLFILPLSTLLIAHIIYNTYQFTLQSQQQQQDASLISNLPIHDPSQLPTLSENGKFDTILQRLSKVIQYESIYCVPEKDEAIFEEMWKWIREEAFSDLFSEGKCHEIENVATKGKLLHCPAASESDLPALLFTSHLDVVPVSNPDKWTVKPFGGEIKDGFVYGRGTLDDKSGVMVILETLKLLLVEEKWSDRRRDIYVSVGFDEEIGGEQGAKEVTEYLLKNNIKFDFVLDEGGYIIDSFPGVSKKVSLIAVAEKGEMTLRLTAEADPGHSSMPKYPSASRILSEALIKLENNKVPANFHGGVMLKLMRAVAPHAEGMLLRMAVANSHIFGWLLERQISAKPQTDAALRTTTAITVIRAGVKVNVIPSKATALVNFRLAPSDNVESVVEHVRRTINDARISIHVHGTQATGESALSADSVGEEREPRLPSAVSCSNCAPFNILKRSAETVFPGTIVAPYLFIAGSDSKHYRLLSPNAYGFIPYRIYESRNDFARVHGFDERISIDNYKEMIQFMYALMRNLGDASYL